MDPKRPTISEWQRFGKYTVWAYNQGIGVRVEGYVSNASFRVGMALEKIKIISSPIVKAFIETLIMILIK